MELIFQEGDYIIKRLNTYEEFEAALKLRHDVFREELKWVPPSPDGLDRDEYDSHAQSIGIFGREHNLLGHVRLIQAPAPFMIEKEFACLLPNDSTFKKLTGMAESTRICVSKAARTDSHMSMTLANLLYKAMYHWSMRNNIRHLITIVEKRYYILLKRNRFPFETIGDFHPLGDGVMSGIISLEWRKFDEIISQKRPEFYDWFVKISDFDLTRLQSHGSY